VGILIARAKDHELVISLIPDVVKGVRAPSYPRPSLTCTTQFIIRFHQVVLGHNLAEITVAYESGWNKYTEKFYAKSDWPEAEAIAPLVDDGAFSLFS
jgi:hypothetical protein